MLIRFYEHSLVGLMHYKYPIITAHLFITCTSIRYTVELVSLDRYPALISLDRRNMPRSSNVVNPLELSGIIGDVVSPFVPSTDLRVSYGNRRISNGCDVRPSQVETQPRVDIGGDDLRNFYTLIMVDPDAPSPTNPHLREYLHWLVTDIPGTTGTQFGREVMCYEAPRPSMGIHRIVFILFRQLGRETVYAPPWRQNFITQDFAEIYNLGLPLAAVYFNCQREAGTGGRRI